MIRVANTTEKNAIILPQAIIAVTAATSTEVLFSISNRTEEFLGRYIQNVGANACYVNIGADCNPTNFIAILAPSGTLDANGYGSGQQFDCSNTGQRVTIYSLSGTTIARYLIRRDDIDNSHGGILSGFVAYTIAAPVLIDLEGGLLKVDINTPHSTYWELESSVDNVTWIHSANQSGLINTFSVTPGLYYRVYAQNALHQQVSYTSNAVLAAP